MYVSDVQYIEDYLQNDRDKLDKMAQAYSDYGVLEEKKDCKEGKNEAGKEIQNSSKMSTQKRGVMEGKVGIFFTSDQKIICWECVLLMIKQNDQTFTTNEHSFAAKENSIIRAEMSLIFEMK